MKCGRVEELIDWVIDSITKNPEKRILVATGHQDEKDLVSVRIYERLLGSHTGKVQNWSFSKNKIGTPHGGFVKFVNGWNCRSVRGFSVDEVLYTDTISHETYLSLEPAEKSP